ncbi:MAG: NUMOD4 motif-containing HNH endonuclease [Streptococcaceae bacterium]|jgi:hypothetical protein|nr:NUMOD4 motif-containing HNH endonuclease [Streptococcaceae bacterium]
MEQEKWKDLPGYEGIYQVSNLGNVRTSKDKITFSKLHGERHWKQRILKPKTDKNGYKRVSLWKDGKEKTSLVHRLVAIAFLSKINGKDYINHIDGNPSNNNVANLEWCNHHDNLLHAFKNRLNQSPDPIVLFNKLDGKTHFFYSKSKASEFLGRNKGYISNCLKRGKTSVENYEIYIRPSKKETF